MDRFTYQDEIPGEDEYLEMRASVGFSDRSPEAVSRGLPGSLYSVTAREENGCLAGMARIVGDGGCSFLIVDVIVTPEFQGRGIGSEIMRCLSAWIESEVPAGGMVCLMADEPGRKLYERHGFSYTAPESLGMKRFIPMK